ncbi:energy transducer TonB [Paraburkholderia sp.]|uniref:energy transducer TonB n=1 Tax=Paraburkholderia sp. TaxID=1926495 RepID=UPI0025F1C159|nr:energy transducer TonB [Paraburkholderia sp.]
MNATVIAPGMKTSSDAAGTRLAIAIIAGCLIEAALIAGVLSHRLLQTKTAVPPAPIKITRVVEIADAPPVSPPPAPRRVEPKPVEHHRAQPVKQRVARPAIEPKVVTAPAATEAPPAESVHTDHPPLVSEAQPVAMQSPQKAPGIRRGLVPLTRVEPEYPSRALADNVEGTVTAHLTIEADGSVGSVKIMHASPAGLFERASTHALMKWKFAPNDGGYVGEVTLTFNLSN